ncbi:hypothetical protein [Undibacterium fentianense]|uniref:Uncharacterized protein n=1 Tax=Undibacterium fentianense TaxID=2828728 RepID=A0A941E329_9BURK|nr:hypothetical protein [Undibacterium fentianense]MBR7800172.1 hypothetical protein [Undibacterium fentianense]
MVFVLEKRRTLEKNTTRSADGKKWIKRDYKGWRPDVLIVANFLDQTRRKKVKNSDFRGESAYPDRRGFFVTSKVFLFITKIVGWAMKCVPKFAKHSAILGNK